MKIQQLDHLVLTVKDMQKSIEFYTEVLGMQFIEFAENRKALTFGSQKINLHQLGDEHKPHAQSPTAGSADLCFLLETSLASIQQELNSKHIRIESGPVERSGATGKLISIYIRDPDNNLIELSNSAL